jgi:hypothetical protein
MSGQSDPTRTVARVAAGAAVGIVLLSLVRPLWRAAIIGVAVDAPLAIGMFGSSDS